MQKIINELKLDFDDVLIKPKRSNLSSRSDVSLIRDFKFLYSPRPLSCVPIMVANMDTTGTMSMADKMTEYNCITCLHKHYSIQDLKKYFISKENNSNLIFYSTGVSHTDIQKLTTLMNSLTINNSPLPNLCIDVANGYHEKFVKNIKHIRDLYPEIIIMAGNVVTPEMVEELIIHGKVDIVKVGIGSGSVCTTRLKTGIGYPQLSAIMECSDAAHGLGGHICSDGGCKTPGDFAKAFGANADFVMSGSMFAGCNECEGEWKYEYLANIYGIPFWQPMPPHNITDTQDQITTRKTHLEFYGMSSKKAMEKYNNGIAKYKTEEGKCVTIPYKGLASEILQDILGGLRSACTYIGACKIKDFGKKTTFIQVNNTHNRIYNN